MRTVFITLIFSLSTIYLTGQTKADETGSVAQISPGNHWFNTDTAQAVNHYLGRSFILAYQWNLNDSRIRRWAEFMQQTVENENVVFQYGIHIPFHDGQKDSSRLSRMARNLSMDFPQVNDTLGQFDKEAFRAKLPRIVLVHPDGTEELLVENGQAMIADMAGHVKQTIARVKSEYNRPGKTLFQASSATLRNGVDQYGVLSCPSAIEVDETTGSIFISDTGNNRILITDLNGVIKGSIGSGESGDEDGVYLACKLNNPEGIALSEFDRKLYIADTGNNKIKVVDLNEQKVSTLFGNGEWPSEKARFMANAQSPLFGPKDIELDGFRLLITMAQDSRFWELNLESLEAKVLVGSGERTGEIGKKTKMKTIPLSLAGSITYDHLNRPLFTDLDSPRIYYVEKGKVKVLLGKETEHTFLPADFEEATIAQGTKLLYSDGDVYLVDRMAAKIGQLDVSTGQLMEVIFSSGDVLVDPVDMEKIGNVIYVCDQGDNQILKYQADVLQGIKISGHSKLDMGLAAPGDFNMQDEIVMNAELQNRLLLDFELPDGFMWDIDNASTILGVAGEELVLSSNKLGSEPIEVIAFPKNLRFQMTFIGELNFCSIEDPSRCFNKKLNLIIPLIKDNDAPQDHELKVNLLPELSH